MTGWFPESQSGVEETGCLLFWRVRERIPEKQIKELKAFEEALKLFFKRDFEEALTRFVILNSTAEESSLYRLYADRSSAYIASPPGDDWDGVTTLMEK